MMIVSLRMAADGRGQIAFSVAGCFAIHGAFKSAVSQ
jgi:hypothetical protein